MLSLIVFVLLDAAGAPMASGRPRRRFEPTDLDLRDKGVAEIDTQVGYCGGSHPHGDRDALPRLVPGQARRLGDGRRPRRPRRRRRLVADQALRINETVETAVYNSTTSVADFMIERLDRNEPVGRIRAELRSYLRNQVRRGPESAGGVAIRLRRGELEKEGNFVKLSAHEEGAVLIEEMSDGIHDWIRVTLRGDPMRTNDPGRIEMAFTTNSTRNWLWAQVRPTRTPNGDAVFEVEVTDGMRADLATTDFQANFRDTGSDKRFDNYGSSFGRGARYVLGASNVDAELAQLAHVAYEAKIVDRERSTPNAVRQAVAARPLVPTKTPPPPKALFLKAAASDDTLHIRRAALAPPPLPLAAEPVVAERATYATRPVAPPRMPPPPMPQHAPSH